MERREFTNHNGKPREKKEKLTIACLTPESVHYSVPTRREMV